MDPPSFTPERDYFSCTPTEIRMEIYKRCDALTLYLNWVDASRHLPSACISTRCPAPSPLEIWIAALESDFAGDIGRLPLAARRLRSCHGTIIPSAQTCLPDVAVLCKFIKSRDMLQRIYDSRLHVPDDSFTYKPPSPRNAVHAAMRNFWIDMIDETADHWDYFQHLVTQRRPDEEELVSCTNDFFDYAARNGELKLLQRIPDSVTGTFHAMDWAAMNGHLDVVKWLHSNRSEGCSLFIMHYAGEHGHLDVVKWLHERLGADAEGIDGALQGAHRNGHRDIVAYLSDLH